MTVSPKRPNVLFLGIDALRSDRTTPYGYDRNTTPTLGRLADDGILCRNAFSLAPFTQPASVQTFTSSRPLSHGGYDMGAIGRPDTIFHQFKRAGYRTTALSTLHWVNRYFGYGSGLDVEYQLFTLNTLVGVAIAITRNSIAGYHAGDIAPDQMLAVVKPVFDNLFLACDDYSQRRIDNAEEMERDFADSMLINARYDFEKVRKVVKRHREAFEKDPRGYIDTHLRKIPRAHEWLGREWYYCRKPTKLVAEAWVRGLNHLIRPFDPSLARLRENRFKQYVDAEAVANKVIRLIETHEDEQPFFLWAHFMDTHLPYVSGSGRRWWRNTPEYLRAVGHDPKIDPSLSFLPGKPSDPAGWEALSALYDASLRWTDDQIGRIVDALDRKGLRDDTVIAVCGDHGEELGEHGNYSHYFLPYEHNVRIPMVLSGPGVPSAQIDGLVTLMDVGPTLASLAGIEPASDWEGIPVQAQEVATRDHVVMETFYGGNCLFADRPLYFGLRTRTHKYFWKEYRDPNDWQSAEGHELYDLTVDPEESNNIYRDDHPLVAGFNEIVARRMAELPEISNERLLALFGHGALTGARATQAAQ